MSRSTLVGTLAVVIAVIVLAAIFLLSGGPAEVPSLSDNVPGSDPAAEPLDPADAGQGETDGAPVAE